MLLDQGIRIHGQHMLTITCNQSGGVFSVGKSLYVKAEMFVTHANYNFKVTTNNFKKYLKCHCGTCTLAKEEAEDKLQIKAAIHEMILIKLTLHHTFEFRGTVIIDIIYCETQKLPCLCYITLYAVHNYHIAGKFGGELNLAVWRSALQLPN